MTEYLAQAERHVADGEHQIACQREIIDELENVSRGPYAGCIGYFSFSGNLDSCITIRTIVVTGGKAYVQAGAGIVADSNPQKEYTETVNKAKAQILAIEKAYRQFAKC